MTDKLRPTLADYIVTALSPMLIMGLVGSLVYFLVEILYAGKYEGRLLWTLFFFVVGIVLVARISIEIGSSQATIYGIGLAVVSWIALVAFIRYPEESPMSRFAGLINLFLMAIVWWSAHRLTWDCTFIDEKRKASGRGLLSAAGFEQHPETRGQARGLDLDEPGPPSPRTSRLPLLERWRRYRERRKSRPHNPGLTVIWFSLAALPIFGLGQSLIPPGDTARRSFTFWLAACYVGCALGLLLATSFLGLRRYLRQRKVAMPKAMAGVWLGVGGVAILAFVLIAALLPRPYSETPIWNVKKMASADRKSSKNAVVKGDAGQGPGKDGRRKGADARDGDQGEGGKSERKLDGQDTGKEGETDGDRRQGKSKQGGGDAKGNGEGSEDGSDEKQSSDPGRRLPDTPMGNVLEKLLTFLKWLVFIVLALVVVGFLFRGALTYMAGFMPGARRLLAALSAWWNRLGRKQAITTSSASAPVKPARKPFTSFTNPFADGTGEGRSLEDLVEYSFASLEAWAADRNHGRRRDETALEFAARLSNTFPSLEGEARQLAILVVRLAYANGTLPADTRAILDRVWDRLTSTFPTATAADGVDR